ncbi:lysophospholipase [Promethearchaeum syntrophicum]|uniref:Lysophospholipase n=1 Tax=Promethearchaeum syntrophicum TaxID=2594042 RepID=A0A5B9DAL2_9ARCH|nr:alpha/beta hydrolase [Candidatus Prometheoarchaeum syntrophicum]QEE15636.1 lysophospholipase L2 [Candidatus Prometheoarchaeum syntrophicum]
MQSSTFTFKDKDDIEIFVYKWQPEGVPKAAVQIAHGMAEHALRYERVAEALTKSGYICYANDHRGHGKTAGDLEKTGSLGQGGWDSTVEDLKELTDYIKKENPDIPFFFLGHSWGSLMGQDYIQQWGKEIKGVILSGTNGSQSKLLLFLGMLIAKSQLKKGPEKRNEKLDDMTFGAFNKPYEPAETKFQWLSRDQDEVNKYVEDPYCGFVCTTSYFVEVLKGLKKIWKKKNEIKIPKDLPILILAGDKDPSSNMGKALDILIKRYEKYGIKNITKKIYKDARHEVFNEINRDEVIQDLVKWLDEHI